MKGTHVKTLRGKTARAEIEGESLLVMETLIVVPAGHSVLLLVCRGQTVCRQVKIGVDLIKPIEKMSGTFLKDLYITFKIIAA